MSNVTAVRLAALAGSPNLTVTVTGPPVARRIVIPFCAKGERLMLELGRTVVLMSEIALLGL
jgi:hypothetical protein